MNKEKKGMQCDFEFEIVITETDLIIPSHRKILQEILNGRNTKQIAQNLSLSPETVKNHINGVSAVKNHNPSLRGLFGVAETLSGKRPCNRAALIYIFLEYGILELKKTR